MPFLPGLSLCVVCDFKNLVKLQFKGSLVEGPQDSQHMSAGFECGQHQGKQAATLLPTELECP